MQKRLQLTSPQRTIAVKNLWIGLLYEHWARASYFSEPFIVVDFARDLNSQLPRDLCYDFVEIIFLFLNGAKIKADVIKKNTSSFNKVFYFTLHKSILLRG